MKHPPANPENVALRINGSLLAVGQRPGLGELEAALRGVALADSPVLIRANDEDGLHLVERLHALGRRATQPMHDCRSLEQAEELLAAVALNGDTAPQALGTWALHDVGRWPSERQATLGRIIATLDEGRLHGRFRHESIPRVLVVQRPWESDQLTPELVQRLSFFNLSAGPHVEEGSKR